MSGTNTEDSILSTIPDFKDEAPADGQVADSTTTDTAQTSAPAESNTGTSAQPTQADGKSSGTDPVKPQQPFVRRHDGLLEQPNADNPRVRDLVDPITGRVVAKGGIERGVYEEGQRHRRENDTLKQQVQQLQGFVQSVNQVTQEASRLNVRPEEQMVALRVMSDFMRDPVKTLEYLVAEVKSKGYQIPFLEQGVTPGMDMTAIARMIDTKMAPLTQQQQQTQQLAQLRQRAEQELQTFLAENGEAQENLDLLGRMLQSDPRLTFQSAYIKMIKWAQTNGYDWTRSLDEQARSQQDTSQQPTHQQQPIQQQEARPMPGQGAVRSATTPLSNGQGRQHNENASWNDIVDDAMRETGLRLRSN